MKPWAIVFVRVFAGQSDFPLTPCAQLAMGGISLGKAVLSSGLLDDVYGPSFKAPWDMLTCRTPATI